MSFITIEEIKQQCYLDELDTSEDSYLNLLSSAAISFIQNYTNRIIVKSIDDTSPENALLWSDDIKIAALLLIGGWYENREEMHEKETHAIPYGFKMLITPYKYIPL